MAKTGSFGDGNLFKVRRKSTGLYFKPIYRDPIWDGSGKVYVTINAARTAARNAAFRDHIGGRILIPSDDLEIVEYHVTEHTTYSV